VIFSTYSGFLHTKNWLTRYNVERGIKHHLTNQPTLQEYIRHTVYIYLNAFLRFTQISTSPTHKLRAQIDHVWTNFLLKHLIFYILHWYHCTY
jgi:hypothetical protein